MEEVGTLEHGVFEKGSFEQSSKRRDEGRKEEYRKFALDLAKSHEEFYPHISYNIHWFYSQPMRK